MPRNLSNVKPNKFTSGRENEKPFNKNVSVYYLNNLRRQNSSGRDSPSISPLGSPRRRLSDELSICRGPDNAKYRYSPRNGSPVDLTRNLTNRNWYSVDPNYISPSESVNYNVHPVDRKTSPTSKRNTSSPEPKLKIWKFTDNVSNVQAQTVQTLEADKGIGPESPYNQTNGVTKQTSTRMRIPVSEPDIKQNNLPESNLSTTIPISAKSKFPIYKSDMITCKDSKTRKPPSMDWKNYHRLAVIDGFMDDMERLYPSLCTVGIIGRSIEGRNIKLLKVSDSNVTNAAVWIDSGIHAREWIGPAVNTFVANHIVKNFNSLPSYCKNKDWYFLPVINPDGYEYSHTENRMWRKNRACYRGKCVGVDLNRNFSFGWGGKGSSDNPTHSFYRGTAPFSEPEACADVIANSGISFQVYITLHSYGQVIIFPFACQEDLCPNYIHLLQGATVMSKAIYETNGNVYKVGISKDVMYKASGTSNDWSHGVMGIPYCYLIELRSRKHKFKVPQEEIEESGTEILNCVIALMEHVEKHGYKSHAQHIT